MAIKRSYYVKALWDDEARVFWSESDIKGLHIEAGTVPDFEHLVGELAPDLIFDNHLRQGELGATALKDLIPSVVVRTPDLAVSGT